MNIEHTLRQHIGLITVAELAQLLNSHRQTLYVACREGRIPYLRVGSRVRFDGNAIAEWLTLRTVA